jgi:poly(hydroxyalkanoate) depolymerase family esterase
MQRCLRGAAFGGALGVAGLLTTAQAGAASLQKVNDWGATGVPATASMYIYVPDKLASKPPILVLAHFCGGSASAVFGQAQSGGVVKAADQYGFIMVVPQTSNNCWDVGSTKALTHDGGGDTQAVAEMVKYAITKYQADADRVYATGDSSGGMMTQALMAVYPDVFKGGSAFAGVPAGCWSVGDPDGSWSNACAGGQVTHTAQEWGDMVRAMDPGYTGHRPRVQLFHGDADGTINYNNFKESVKQWTNVLGLSASPTSTETVTLGTHQATRQKWQNACGYVVLDAFTSMGGDHGPSDALFNASFVVPFLALDKTDAVDPEVAQCGTAGMGGSSGGMGGATSAGGANGRGGAMSAGGANGRGGAMSAGGDGSGGVPGAGGTSMSGGFGAGGAGDSGLGMAGTVAGGTPGAGGVVASGGRALAGGPSAGGGSGAAPSAGGTGGVSSGAAGSAANAGTGDTGAEPGSTPSDAGCACAAARHERSSGAVFVLALGAALVRRRRVRAARRYLR